MPIEIEQNDDVCVVHFSGRFATGSDLDYLCAKTEEIKNRSPSKVLADLSAVAYIGSTFIGLLVGIYMSVTSRAGGRFVLVGLNPMVRKVLDVTRLSTVIPLAPDMATGLVALRSEGVIAQSAPK